MLTVSSPRARAIRASWVKLVRETPIEGSPVRMKGPADVAELLGVRAAAELVEVFYVIALDSQSQVLGVCELTRGVLNASLVHPREVFRLALALGCAGIIVAHNHPSGDPTPSADDRAVTRQLADAGRILDVPLYDHVILTASRPAQGPGCRWLSFAEAGLL